jgi:arginine decarboxylase-like protein
MDGEISFEDLMTAIMCLMLATFGLGSAMSDIGDQKSGIQAAHRIFDVSHLVFNIYLQSVHIYIIFDVR